MCFIWVAVAHEQRQEEFRRLCFLTVTWMLAGFTPFRWVSVWRAVKPLQHPVQPPGEQLPFNYYNSTNVHGCVCFTGMTGDLCMFPIGEHARLCSQCVQQCDWGAVKSCRPPVHRCGAGVLPTVVGHRGHKHPEETSKDVWIHLGALFWKG